MSAVKMLTPAYGAEGVKQFILDTVRAAGPNPCPPIVVGVGIGGTFERAAQLAKKATFRPIDTCHPDERYAAMERELLTAINQMGFGPAGLGGKTTALGVNIETSSCSPPSTKWASALPAWAARPPRSASTSRLHPPTSPACPWPSTSAATPQGTRAR